MITRYALIVIVLASFVESGCEKRTRVNPLDPLNPSTGGRLQRLVAIAEHRRVTLTWSPIAVADLSGYRLRRYEIETSSVQEIIVSADYSRYVDLQVVNGRTYQYRVTALITSGAESPPSEAAEATPGPASCWIADLGADALFRTSADGRAVAVQVIGLSDPSTLAIDPGDGGCWTSDQFAGAVVRLTADGGVDVIVFDLTRPGAVAVDARDGACWVAEAGNLVGQNSAIARVRRDGTIQFRIFAFTDPQAIAVNPADGSVWVTDLANRQVSNIDAQGNIRFAVGGFAAPVGVVADPTDGGCWVIDRTSHQVVKLTNTGARTITVSGFTDPVAGSYDEARGSLWVADPGQRGVIMLLTRVIPSVYDIRQASGFHQTVGGLRSPMSVSVDAQTGDCWVADTEDRAVLKLTAEGQVMGKLLFSENSRPIAVAVDPGSRYATAAP